LCWIFIQIYDILNSSNFTHTNLAQRRAALTSRTNQLHQHEYLTRQDQIDNPCSISACSYHFHRHHHRLVPFPPPPPPPGSQRLCYIRLHMLELLRSGVLLPSFVLRADNDAVRQRQASVLDADILSLVRLVVRVCVCVLVFLFLFFVLLVWVYADILSLCFVCFVVVCSCCLCTRATWPTTRFALVAINLRTVKRTNATTENSTRKSNDATTSSRRRSSSTCRTSSPRCSRHRRSSVSSALRVLLVVVVAMRRRRHLRHRHHRRPSTKRTANRARNRAR
jgi:hypothetical protein